MTFYSLPFTPDRVEATEARLEAIYDAARCGLKGLKHQHGWVAKQQIDVNVDQQISVITALERAQTRVIEGTYVDVPQIEDNRTHAAADIQRAGRNGVDDAAMDARDQG